MWKFLLEFFTDFYANFTEKSNFPSLFLPCSLKVKMRPIGGLRPMPSVGAQLGTKMRKLCAKPPNLVTLVSAFFNYFSRLPRQSLGFPNFDTRLRHSTVSDRA